MPAVNQARSGVVVVATDVVGSVAVSSTTSCPVGSSGGLVSSSNIKDTADDKDTVGGAVQRTAGNVYRKGHR